MEPRAPESTTLSSPSILPKPPGWWKSLTSVYQIYPASFLAFSSSSTTTTPVANESAPNPTTQIHHPFPSHLPQPPATGLGDIPGITSRLRYLHTLGVDAIWLSPPYPSPLIDMGYDVADYTSIDPRFGTLSDMDALITAAHALNIRVFMDLVINHTSSQHHWFQESQKSRQGNYADYYIWKDPKPSSSKDTPPQPPNNWPSMFGGSAWTFSPSRGQFYLHLFDASQPDLNWEHPHVRKAIYTDAIHFWLQRGIDGFRVDTCGIYSKDPSFADGTIDPSSRWGPDFGNPLPYIFPGPRIHEFWREIRSETQRYGDVFMVGELGPADTSELLKYTALNRAELSMAFAFEIPSVGVSGFDNLEGFEDVGDGRNWAIPELKAAVTLSQAPMAEDGGWSAVVAENHDQPRSLSRFGSVNPAYSDRSAKVLAVLLGTLSGTLFLYQGQEIGMTNIPLSWNIDDIRDLASIEYYQRKKREHPGDEELLKRVWRGIVAMSRDNARTPMQWDGSENAGFLPGGAGEEPWMKVNDNYTRVNVEKQRGVKGSVWEFWRKVLAVRKQEKETLIFGGYESRERDTDEKAEGKSDDEKLFLFEKRSTHGGKRAVVMLNFSEESVDAELPGVSEGKAKEERKWELLLSNIEGYGEREEQGSQGKKLKLEPWEARVYIQR